MPIPKDLNKNYNPNLFEFSQIGIKVVALMCSPFILFPHFFTDNSVVNQIFIKYFIHQYLDIIFPQQPKCGKMIMNIK